MRKREKEADLSPFVTEMGQYACYQAIFRKNLSSGRGVVCFGIAYRL